MNFDMARECIYKIDGQSDDDSHHRLAHRRLRWRASHRRDPPRRWLRCAVGPNNPCPVSNNRTAELVRVRWSPVTFRLFCM